MCLGPPPPRVTEARRFVSREPLKLGNTHHPASHTVLPRPSLLRTSVCAHRIRRLDGGGRIGGRPRCRRDSRPPLPAGDVSLWFLSRGGYGLGPLA